MADRQVRATFPGVDWIHSATYTRTHGISPGTGSIECFPQQKPIQENGDLVFWAGTDKITIKGCKIGLSTLVYDTTVGPLYSLQVLDRRWKWAYGEINGEYNIRDRKNEVIADSAKDTYELMNRCLEAMGEKNYDTSDVPPGINIHVEWVGTNPAKALADLCDQIGFTVVLQLDDTVAIRKIGEGASLPEGGEMLISPTIDPPERPDSIKVIGAPTRFQALLRLEAVGEDLDGTIKPIDKLSYAPHYDANHVVWSGSDPEFLFITDELTRRLARSRIFRWYRIKVDEKDDDFKLELPLLAADPKHPDDLNKFQRVKTLKEILPISGDLVETYMELGIQRRKKARVYGTYFVGNLGKPRNSNQIRKQTAPGIYIDEEVEGSPIRFQYQEQLASFPGVPSDFSIIEEFGVVEFPQPVFKAATLGSGSIRRDYLLAATDLYLMCSFNWRNAMPPQTTNVRTALNAFFRYGFEVEAKGKKYGTGPEIINKENEFQAQIYARYNAASPGIHPEWIHLRPVTEINEGAQHYIDGAAQKYVTTKSDDRSYCGLRKIDNDGAIKQVTWSVGPAGPETRGSRNTEPHPYVRPYRFTRFLERMEQLSADPRARVPDLPRPYIPPVT